MRLTIAAVALMVATPVVAQSPFAPAPASVDWTGGFVGITAGGARSTGEATRGAYGGALLTLDVSNGLFPGSIDDAETGAIAGFGFGYDRQSGTLVTGVELDLSLSSLDVENGFSRIDPNPNFPFTGVTTITGYHTDLNGLATARLRVGYAQGRSLVYATGGLAAGRVENRFTLDIPDFPAVAGGPYSSPDWRESGTRLGYVVGAGYERMVGTRLSAKVEVLHYDLADVTVRGSDPATFPGETINYKFDNSGVVGRFGLSFRF